MKENREKKITTPDILGQLFEKSLAHPAPTIIDSISIVNSIILLELSSA